MQTEITPIEGGELLTTESMFYFLNEILLFPSSKVSHFYKLLALKYYSNREKHSSPLCYILLCLFCPIATFFGSVERKEEEKKTIQMGKGLL